MPRVRLAVALAALAAAVFTVAGVPTADGQIKKKAAQPPPKAPAKASPATDPATMKVAKGFKVELLYTVPKAEQGSWVALCVDPKGRLVTSDQYGALYRITPPPLNGKSTDTRVEKLPVDIGMAQGLLYAFDALYVVVNHNEKGGLYRVTDTNGDDVPDRVQLLRKFEGYKNGGLGEHGPHAVLKHPDGKRLTVVCGNQTALTKFDTTRVPPVWGEDHLLPRLPDGNGFMAGVMGPGGAIYNVSPDGTNWELFSVGFRNQYDAAYNAAGDLFTYDADMEWDFNTPWYRPTRVCLVTSGSEFGWRNGAGKFPPYYLDNLPGVANIGPGSPTGVAFGYGARFPARYQQALFICDWSYGKLYAVHLAPEGSGYKSEVEEFITGTPLPLTDLVVNPTDGALYFTIGGRRTTSGLYRVTYSGEGVEPPTTRRGDGPAGVSRADRLAVEQYHTKQAPEAVPAAWKLLDSKDRFASFAARVALEHQPTPTWADKALAEADPLKAIPAVLALARVGAQDPFHRAPGAAPPSADLRGKLLAALGRIDPAKLDDTGKLDLLRTYQVVLNRYGKPEAADAAALAVRFDAAFPAKNRLVNAELCQVLVFLESPTAAAKTMKLLADAPTQEEQLEYLRALRVLRTGWTPELRQQYFTWFLRAANFRGGNSMAGFIRRIKADAVATLTPAEATALKPIIDAQPGAVRIPEEAPRPFVKAYTMADLAPALEKGLAGGRDFEKGRRLFGAAKCFACHRYDNEGGSYGPDLSGAAGRFNARDLLESIVDPNKEISDQYAAVEIRTADDRVVVGRIVNLNGDVVKVNTNMLDPNALADVNRNNIESMRPSRLSMMPAGLLDTLKEDEVLDLMAYLLSRGDRTAPAFRK
ncbi:c-type cytochrome [Urbifossiella limnaea]|uniref:Cytochrome c n=1 Tax=Urbifossiella limnaea TaxID=2528023 RepID=A0A517XXW7_9BACT|nr:c-type cytochrome [Urbifossiella limnaea]QDU22349.1 Cytochrome c [Urbifossiella limnaea]